MQGHDGYAIFRILPGPLARFLALALAQDVETLDQAAQRKPVAQSLFGQQPRQRLKDPDLGAVFRVRGQAVKMAAFIKHRVEQFRPAARFRQRRPLAEGLGALLGKPFGPSVGAAQERQQQQARLRAGIARVFEKFEQHTDLIRLYAVEDSAPAAHAARDALPPQMPFHRRGLGMGAH